MIKAKDIPNTNIKPMESISDLQLEKINRFTTTPHTKEQLFTFEMLLIDDTPTRNFTLYPESFQRKMLKKPVGGGNWIGLPMLMGTHEDHEAMASNQVGRIYDARLVRTPRGRIGTIASVYIPVTESTKTLIDNIKAGVHKEVSIGVTVEEPTCSICGHDIRECNHEPGDNYNGADCYIVMNGDVEGQEVSFVAVPGSTQAKILSDTNKYIPLTEALHSIRGIKRKENKRMAKKMRASKETLALLKLARYAESMASRLKDGSVAPTSPPDPTDGKARGLKDGFRYSCSDDEDEYDPDDDHEDDEHEDRNDTWTEEDDCEEDDEEDDEDDDEEYDEGLAGAITGGVSGAIGGAIDGAIDGAAKGAKKGIHDGWNRREEYDDDDDEDEDEDEDKYEEEDEEDDDVEDEEDDDEEEYDEFLDISVNSPKNSNNTQTYIRGHGNNVNSQVDSSRHRSESYTQAKALKAIEKSLRKVYKANERLQRQARDGRKYKESVLKETIRLGTLAGVIPIQSKEMFRKTFRKLSTKELLHMQKGYKKQVEAMYPSTGKARAIQESRRSRNEYSNNSMSITDIVNEFNK